MNKKIIFFSSIFLGLIFLCFALYTNHENIELKNKLNNNIDTIGIYKYKLDSINNQIDLIQCKIDTVYQDKIKIKYVYKQKADSIWNQSSSDDWNYFIEFLRSKFPSDTAAIETNRYII